MTTTTAHIEDRSQGAKGTWPRRGPDRYVAVQIVPEGQEPLKVLRKDWAARKGIEIKYCGEYYGTSSNGPRSMYAAAMAEANRIVAEHKGA